MPSRAYVVGVRVQGSRPAEAGSGVLSGGERNRLNLALTLKEGR